MAKIEALVKDRAWLYPGDNLDFLKICPDNKFDSIVTDPPYGIGFMNHSWDHPENIAFSVDFWKECLRVLKPGGHLLAFSGSRTYHRMAIAIEDAGFEVRDQMMWIYGQGFPKGQDIGKGIDAKFETGGSSPRNIRMTRMGENYEATGQVDYRKGRMFSSEISNDLSSKAPNHELAKKYDGWNTQLKPAHEPICMARKPLSEKTVVDNVLKWGAGSINITGCVIETDDTIKNSRRSAESAISKGKYGNSRAQEEHQTDRRKLGRYPANVMHDGSDEVVSCFPNDSHKFFYCPKASKQDRNGSKHVTVKPIRLMEYLCRLVTPENGVVFDPFAGSGTTLRAALNEGFRAMGCEITIEYQNDVRDRFRETGHD